MINANTGPVLTNAKRTPIICWSTVHCHVNSAKGKEPKEPARIRMINANTGPVSTNAKRIRTICCSTVQCHVTSVNGIRLLTAEMSSILQFKLKQMVRTSGLQLLTLTMTNSYGDKIRMDEFTIKQLAKCGYLTNMEADLRLLEQISSGISTVIMRIQRFTLKPFQIN